jgi:hypothetical protein
MRWVHENISSALASIHDLPDLYVPSG